MTNVNRKIGWKQLFANERVMSYTGRLLPLNISHEVTVANHVRQN